MHRASTDTFIVEGQELGDLTHVTVGHDSSGQNPAWHLEALTVMHVPSGQQWHFSCEQCFDLHHGDGLAERDLFLSR